MIHILLKNYNKKQNINNVEFSTSQTRPTFKIQKTEKKTLKNENFQMGL